MLTGRAQQRPSGWLVDGKREPDSDWSKSSNGFGAQLIVVGDPKAFVEMWSKPEKPNIETAKSIARGQQFAVFILFAGCKAGVDGSCDTTVSYYVSEPDGKTLAERHNQIVWAGPELDKRTTYLGKAALGLKFTENNPVGVYVIKAIVSDKYSSATLELKATVELKGK
jgi:hypothetical protein